MRARDQFEKEKYNWIADKVRSIFNTLLYFGYLLTHSL